MAFRSPSLAVTAFLCLSPFSSLSLSLPSPLSLSLSSLSLCLFPSLLSLPSPLAIPLFSLLSLCASFPLFSLYISLGLSSLFSLLCLSLSSLRLFSLLSLLATLSPVLSFSSVSLPLYLSLPISASLLSSVALFRFSLLSFSVHYIAIPTDPIRCSQREGQATITAALLRQQLAADEQGEAILLGDFNDYDGEVLDIKSDQPTSK